MESDRFGEYLNRWRPAVDAALDGFLPPEDRVPAEIHQSMRYTVFAGGKRFRPVLCLLSAKAAGGSEEDAMAFACALEMVHAFSLVHDDLPAMDDDDLRRGKPTNHKVFGEAIAVLAGDGLLNQAFLTLLEGGDDARGGRAVRILGDAVGTAGIIGGQVDDIRSEGATPDLELVERIHRSKTAALIAACARLGALAAKADPSMTERLAGYAEAVGLAFQIRDDILDETCTAEELGKTAGKDKAAGKMTYPAAVGLEAADRKARELAATAIDLVRGLPGEEELVGLAQRVVTRGT